MKSVFVLLAIAMVAHAEPKQQEIRLKRTTPLNVIGYVNTAAGGCRALTGKVGTYCNLGYQTPSTIAIRFTATLEPLVDRLNGNTLSASCKSSVKELLCKSYFPKCSSSGTKAQYQSFSTACNGIASCNGLSSILGTGISTSGLCAMSDSTRTINVGSCSRYPSNSINQNLCGSLPSNITFSSVTDVARDAGLLTTFAATFSSALGVSASCRTQWQKFLCVEAQYCGYGSQVLSAVTKQQCQSALNCLPDILKTTYSVLFACSNYPDQGATRVCVDSSKGFTQLDPSVTTCNSASAVAIGSTLFYLACAFLAYFH